MIEIRGSMNGKVMPMGKFKWHWLAYLVIAMHKFFPVGVTVYYRKLP